MHRKVAAALVAALALGVASCGGSETLTRAELVDRIEAACRQAQRLAQQDARAGGRETNFFAAIVAGQRALVKSVEGLEAPDELSEDVDRLKAGLAQRVDLVADLADMPESEQQRALAAVNDEIESTTRDVEGAFRRLGVSGCS
jgi:hypothetical protein